MPAPLIRTKGPKRLKPRHFTMAAYVAAGFSDAEIGKTLGVSPTTVKATRQSPLFKVEVERLTRRNVERISDNYVDQVKQDGATNVAFLKKVRGGKLADLSELNAADRMRFRLDASKTLFQHQMPRQDPATGPAGVTIVLQQAEQVVMAEAVSDVGVSIPQLDDVIAEFRRVEQDEAARSDR